jgi:hypothetical protein
MHRDYYELTQALNHTLESLIELSTTAKLLPQVTTDKSARLFKAYTSALLPNDALPSLEHFTNPYSRSMTLRITQESLYNRFIELIESLLTLLSRFFKKISDYLRQKSFELKKSYHDTQVQKLQLALSKATQPKAAPVTIEDNELSRALYLPRYRDISSRNVFELLQTHQNFYSEVARARKALRILEVTLSQIQAYFKSWSKLLERPTDTPPTKPDLSNFAQGYTQLYRLTPTSQTTGTIAKSTDPYVTNLTIELTHQVTSYEYYLLSFKRDEPKSTYPITPASVDSAKLILERMHELVKFERDFYVSITPYVFSLRDTEADFKALYQHLLRESRLLNAPIDPVEALSPLVLLYGNAITNLNYLYGYMPEVQNTLYRAIYRYVSYSLPKSE